MSANGYRSVSLPDDVYDELEQLINKLYKDTGIKPKSIAAVIQYLLAKYEGEI